MRVKTSKIGLLVFFVVLLATPFILSNYSHWINSVNIGADQQSSLERYGFYLEETSAEWGVDFTHHGPRLDSKLNHIMPQISSVGAAVSVVDVDNDGKQDFYLTNSAIGTKNSLYKNLGDGQFKDIAGEMGVADVNKKATGVSMSGVWADYNNDGYEDLFLVRWGKPALFHNENGEGFTEVTLGSEFPQWVNANTAVWFDYNNDGLVDLFLGGYFHESINLWDLETTKIMPESFEYAQNGGRKFLFQNLGDGTFKEVSEDVGLNSNRWCYAAASADLNEDGFADLVIANDYGVDELFINQNGEKFVDAGDAAGMGFAPKSGMNVSMGDIMNRGELSIYITNISEPGVLLQGNNLWVPASRNKKQIKLQNLAGNLGIEMAGWSYGAQFGDLNLDGYLDLYVANGFISAEKGTDYWYDFSMVAGGNTSIIADAGNWPAMKGRSLSGFQKNKIWINDGAGSFQEVADAVGGSLDLDSRAVAYADLNNDGRLEILVASQKAPFKIFTSTVNEERNWISFNLQGTRSNSSAIGAEVLLYWNSNVQKRTVHSASGFSAQNQRQLHFGLGDTELVDKAVIKWPSGISDTLVNPQLNTIHSIQEGSQ